jgi:hypothetical protein
MTGVRERVELAFTASLELRQQGDRAHGTIGRTGGAQKS